MEERLNSLAWTILSDVHAQAVDESSHESRLLIEAVRLAALNRVVLSRFDGEYLGLDKNRLLLSALSYGSQKRNVSKRVVGELVRAIIDDARFSYHGEVENLSLIDFIDLLGRIHSLGSHRLPVSLQQASSQRPLGAFYTPMDVADYIVNLTFAPKLRKYTQLVRREGLSAARELLSLSTIDPACGSGVFLVSSIRIISRAIQDARLALEKQRVSTRDFENYFSNASFNIYGVDMDAGALEVADASIRFLESAGESRLKESHIGSTLKQGDSLISMNGFSHISGNSQFFSNPESRTPFEWRKEFTEVFSGEQSGFDFVVMNPPYERLKPNFAEFMREELLSGEREVHTSRYEDYKSRIRENTRYFRESNEFKLAISYSLNTYQLFIERALQISKMGGIIGCIVPSNILCDISSQSLRHELLLHNTVNSIDDFPETSRVFPGVTQSVSILILTKGGKTEVIELGLNRTGVEDATRRERLKIERDRIFRMMGNSLVIPRVDKSNLMLLEKMHKQPAMSSIDYLTVKRGELDLTLNKRFITSSNSGSKLIRGSHITRYALRESNRDAEYADYEAFRKAIRESERVGHITANRIACQQVSNMGQRWRLKFAPIDPLMILSNSCNYLVDTQSDSVKRLDFLLGVLNSELLNWRFQISNSNNHVSIRELQSLPIAQPSGAQKALVKEVIKDVRKLKANRSADASSVEALVFALYGFGVKEAQRILSCRKTPEIEKKRIIDELSHLVGERLSN